MKQFNAQTKKPYTKSNNDILLIKKLSRGYSSEYWATEKQLVRMGRSIKEGEDYAEIFSYYRTMNSRTYDPSKLYARSSKVYNLDQTEYNPNNQPEQLSLL